LQKKRSKKIGLESDKKKPNKDEIWKKKSNLNLTSNNEIKREKNHAKQKKKQLK
jgi:hypothetical protein